MAHSHGARVLAAAFAMALVLALPSACGSGVFVCSTDDDCAGGGPGGLCEPQGWCSFTDPGCPTGQRFGDLAGDGLAGACVPDDDGTSGAGTTVSSTTTTMSSTDTATSGATTDPTVASLEGGIETSSDASSGADTDSNVCGDGVIGGSEECDFGNDNGDGAACRDDCRLNVCGDGYVGPGEQCDGDPGCTAECTTSECGNGILEPGEECDSKDGPGLQMCADIGYVEGTYECNDCTIDASECLGCGANGCSYGPCDVDDDCDLGEECIHLDNSFCTAPCATDEDCLGELPQACVEIKGPAICLPLCEDGDGCPAGLTCFAQVMPPVCL